MDDILSNPDKISGPPTEGKTGGMEAIKPNPVLQVCGYYKVNYS